MTVNLNGTLKKYARNENGKDEVILDNVDTIDDLLNSYGFEKGEVGVIVVNGALVQNPNRKLEPDDNIKLYPIFGGGISKGGCYFYALWF